MMFRRWLFRPLFVAVLTAGLFAFGPVTGIASACPMCKTANETDDARPKAYMYSILFMLSVPAMIFTGLGIGLYKLNRLEKAALEQLAEQIGDTTTQP